LTVRRRVQFLEPLPRGVPHLAPFITLSRDRHHRLRTPINARIFAALVKFRTVPVSRNGPRILLDTFSGSLKS
jgi:hypothetical protein